MRTFKIKRKKAGLTPGALVHVGEQHVDRVTLTRIQYDEKELVTRELEPDAALPPVTEQGVVWLNICGLHDIGVFERLGKFYDIDPLILEDVLNTDHRPKADLLEDSGFILVKMIRLTGEGRSIDAEQLSVILKQNLVITFQERPGDLFDPIRERLKNPRTRLRRRKADYLTYALIDVVVDYYFVVLEAIGEKLEDLEAEVIGRPDTVLLERIHAVRGDLIFMRKSIWPMREVISTLMRDESPLFEPTTEPFLRDLYDHTIQAAETLESYRDLISSLRDIYLSSVSNSMNEVMKVLTIIATIFIPLTFIAGIYGMNFEYMPELKWHWSYPLVWIVMIAVVAGMVCYFRRKKWL